MNKNIALGLVVVIVVLGGVYMATRSSSTDKMVTKDGAMMESDHMMDKNKEWTPEEMEAMKNDDTMMEKDAMIEKDGAMMMKGGQYTTYDASKIAFAKEGKVVLFFNASWCPTCKAVDADIKAHMSDIPANTLILSVDYDTHKDLKTKYGVTTQHTFVQVDSEGNSLGKWVGGDTLKSVLSNVK
ncbi:MAG: thioredoxin family protein [Candidatus Moranbacteria bacterium]|nr:thioredoxin family protein [Candidatus Moranbacteria bacterium]